MNKLSACVIGSMFIAGCTTVPGADRIAAPVAPAGPQLPEGYVNVAQTNLNRMAAHLLSKWIKAATNNEEIFSRGVRVYGDLRKDYYDRLAAQYPQKDVKKLITEKIIERANMDMLPPGTKGLGVLVDEKYPVANQYQPKSGGIVIPAGSFAYSYKIPLSDAVLDATVSRNKSFAQNLFAITDASRFEGKRVHSQVSLLGYDASLGYAMSQEEFSKMIYEDRKSDFETFAKVSGYILFDISKCEEDAQSQRLACYTTKTSTQLKDIVLVKERAGRR